MAWFRKMGADAVEYHEKTVVGREDDHPGRALAYYGARGETPLVWGGAEAARLGLAGEVTPDAYRAVFGPGGFRDPLTGEQLTSTTVPGFEVVVSAHKSLAVLGVIGRADDMHTILDEETRWTMATLEGWMRRSGGRRGKAAVPTPTTGLVYATSRHGTSRAGDPAPHDHVLIANYTHMLDAKGGPKALHSALVRDWAEAAAMAARMYSAARAVELGYAIELDPGESGRARDWRILGIPQQVCDLFSKRRDEIADYLDEHGFGGYRARNVAARVTRDVKRQTGIDELLPQWVTELEHAGWTIEGLHAALEEARRHCAGLARRLTDAEIDQLTARLLDPGGEFSTRWKVFGRSRLIAEVAPMLYGHHPDELYRVVNHIIASNLVVPLIGVGATHEQYYATAAVLANEQAIAERVEHLAATPGPSVPAQLIRHAMTAKEAEIGGPLSAGQRATVQAVCGSGRSVEVIVGVAGAGKTTALDAAATALRHAGYRVVGTATSGQAARTLSREARIEARTMRSLLYRLDHGQLQLDDRTVVMLDEAGMTADTDLARLLLAAERAGTKVVLVGDPRQLSPVGPGGALTAAVSRHPEIVTELTENKRQSDPAEREALAHMRDHRIEKALAFYRHNDRIRTAPTRTEALAAMVDAWAQDTSQGQETLMLAWQRRNVADLNRLARARAARVGHLTGPELTAPGGKSYAAGDTIVLLAPNRDKGLVTSQRATVIHVDPDRQTLTLKADDDRAVRLSADEIDTERLDHAYAMTVHRTQSATADRTHVFFDGGGPELAYVALSRARRCSTIHTAATSLDEALDEIAYDWQISQAQRWLTDTAVPGTDPRHEHSEPPEPETAAETARDRHTRTRENLAQAREDLDRIRRQLDSLERRPAAAPDLTPQQRGPDRGLSL